MKRFGGFLLPLAKIIGAELLPVFESWGCSRKYVIFNLFLSAVSAVFFMDVAFRCNLKSVSNLLYHGPFQHRKSERRSQQMLVALMKNLMAIEKMYEIKTRYFERRRRVVSVSCLEEHDTFFCSEYEPNIFIRNIRIRCLTSQET